MVNIYIFGTGSGREKFEGFLDQENVNIIGYVDNDPEKQNLKIDGIEIISPLKIRENNYDFLLITSEYYEEILNQLRSLGIYRNILCVYEEHSLESYLNLFSRFMTAENIKLIKLNYRYYGYINYNKSIDINEAEFCIDKNDLVNEVYKNRKNYKIEYSEFKDCEENLCVVYFSSNGVYYPNTESEFRTTIKEKDYYEWYNTRIKRAKKHIFVRDIFKQWYINGINSEINNVDKLCQTLDKETMNYKIICIGSSAGGYAAILCGILLKAQYVFAFSPQFNLNTKSCIMCITEKNRKKIIYSDLCDLINKSSIPIFNFIPYKSLQDIEQYNFIKNYKNVKTFSFNSKNHGVPFGKKSLNHIINLKCQEVEKLHYEFEGQIVEPGKFLNDCN